MNFHRKTVDQILKSYDFPHKFYVKYAVACARLCIAKVDKPSPEALHAIDLADRFSLGDEQISQEELKAAANASYSASYAANTSYYAYAAYYTAYTAYYSAATAAPNAATAAAAANAATATANITTANITTANAANAAANASSPEVVKQLLLDLIDKEFSELEKLLLW
jgi:hypothetical protein